MTSPLTPEERADIGSALDAAFAFLPPIAHTRDFLAAFEAARDMGRLLDAERDSLERRALQAERERDAARSEAAEKHRLVFERTDNLKRHLEEAKARVDSLERERDEASKILADLAQHGRCVHSRHTARAEAERNALEARLERAREALARLAEVGHGFDCSCDACGESVRDRLRAALEPGAGS